jgi:hypothetical protein
MLAYARCTLVGLVLATVPFVTAQVLDASFITLFPELNNLPAPDWVQPGVRLTYTAGAALVPDDPDDRGGGGAGYTQIDVVAVSDKQVVLRILSWGMPSGAGPVVPLITSCYVGPAGAGGDWYLNPQVLKRATDLHDDHLKVVRGPYQAAGKTFDAVRFEWERDGTKNVWVYDAKSGVLLHNGVASERAQSRGLANGDLKRIRTAKIPWADAPVPDWVADVKAVRYTGQYTISVPGVQSYSAAMRMEAKVVDRGATWLRLKRHIERSAIVQGMPSDVDDCVVVSGRAQLAGLWIPPKALQDLKAGQVLDRDPDTGIETRVEDFDTGPNGARVVRIVERDPIYSAQLSYDVKSGLLVGMRVTLETVHTTFDLQLAGRE